MRHVAALAFFLKRSEDIIAAGQITTTAETIHGLLRLDGERLVLQWRAVRETDYVGREIRSDKAIDPLREVELPLSAIASAAVRASWLPLRELVTPTKTIPRSRFSRSSRNGTFLFR